MRSRLAPITTMSAEETQATLQAHGLDSLQGAGFALRRPRVRAGYDWHQHAYHQLIFAISGPSQVETAHVRSLIPQGRAVWIPAGMPHRSLIAGADGGSLFFAPELTQGPDELRFVQGGAVLREMVMLVMRWPRAEGAPSAAACSVFQALALLCAEWSVRSWSPTSRSSDHPRLRRAMDYALADLAAATQAGAAKASALSDRSLRRLFERETGGGWQAWLTSARMCSAAGLLQDGVRVTDVAAEVGYASLSAFAKAFSVATGETPLRYQSRVSRPG